MWRTSYSKLLRVSTIPGAVAIMEENFLAQITSNSLTQELKILGSEEVDLSLNVNNVSYTLKLEPRVTLVDALREKLGLMGTKKACDRGECGACTILVNGRRINSCMGLHGESAWR